MQKKTIFLFFLLISSNVFGQVSFPHISSSTFSAERVANFGIIDVDTDFLEITNSTQFDNSFIPSIWAHQQSDNRFVLRLFATTNSSMDNGNTPLMIFRTEIRNNLNLDAPIGGAFPWGTTASNVTVRPLFAWENGNSQLMRILSNGNVGIGTETPTALLHTTGTVRFENLTDATNPFKVLGTDSSGNVFEYNPTELAGSGTSDADWLKPDGTLPSSIDDTIYTNGLVGINTANPSANLHTVGTLKFENVADATNPFKVLGTDSSGNVFEYNPEEFGSSSSDADWLKLDNSIPMSLNDAIYTLGKVGIGTNSIPNSVGNESVSQYGLFVTGGILTEEVRVAVVNEWADFVFENDYLLPALNEVEKYIKENKHLKGVPTAKEVKENGVELKEMNKILLQKIEELTLYIIELDKKVEQQQIEIEQLKTK